MLAKKMKKKSYHLQRDWNKLLPICSKQNDKISSERSRTNYSSRHFHGFPETKLGNRPLNQRKKRKKTLTDLKKPTLVVWKQISKLAVTSAVRVVLRGSDSEGKAPRKKERTPRLGEPAHLAVMDAFRSRGTSRRDRRR